MVDCKLWGYHGEFYCVLCVCFKISIFISSGLQVVGLSRWVYYVVCTIGVEFCCSLAVEYKLWDYHGEF